MRKAMRHAAVAVVLLAMPGLAALAAGAGSGTEPASSASVIARQGNGRGAPPCASCHGVDGGGQVAAGFPRLAGLDATYLRRQLDAFATGTRANAVMQPIAKALTASERVALAAYYDHMPVPAMVASPAVGKPPADRVGARLALRGRWSKQVPACVACHGPHGVGVGANFPPLAGQPAAYIVAQLEDFKQGSRHNDPLRLMQHVSAALDAADMKAVAAWFAAQPTHVTGASQ